MASRTRRTQKESQGKEFAVIGLGTFGSSLARRLEMMGQTVFAIDVDSERVQAITGDVSSAASMDATNEDALAEVDIASFGTVVVAMADHFEASTLVTVGLKSQGVGRVICLASSWRHREILLRIGADQVILSDEDSGLRLAETLASPNLLERAVLDDTHSLTEMKAPQSLAGHAVANLAQYAVTVLLIQRQANLMPCPPAQTIIEEGDTLFVVGERERLLEVAALP
jgi:trk system potassium uptake protein